MKLLKGFLAIAIALGAVSCDKDDDPAPPNYDVTFKATLSGASEVPANASTATGNATLVFNTNTKMFTVTVNHTIAAPTNGHVHTGAVGVIGPVTFGFSTFTSPIVYSTSVALTAQQEADLMANLDYVNIHTAAFPSGEIRGQLIKQ
ncbi:MAG TPA: CHRD domain-containing protein [Ferruginibacter sp.]|nr:CHRD domain-containing protein [Ferruginibacter sp.]